MEAARSGAGAAVVSARSRYLPEFTREIPGFPLIKVHDTTRALGDLACFVRKGLDAKVVGITGTTGKTCTKDFLVAILSRLMRVVHSPGNYNNEIGLPLTIFDADEKDQAIVLEMGARRPGDIRRLAGIAEPGFGIITNVGPGHLELFKTEEKVARTKAELAESISDGGVLVLNADDPRSDWIASRTSARVLRFGLRADAEYRAADIVTDGLARPSFRLKGPGLGVDVILRESGRLQVPNALAAAACAHAMGAGPAEIQECLGRASLSPWRMEVKKAPDGYVVINDTYNANPLSMRSALATLAEFGPGSRTVAVLGGMAELGANSREFHKQVGACAAEVDIDILVTVGRQARSYATAALVEGMPRGSVFRCGDISEAEMRLGEVLEPGDAVLLKASRVARLEVLAARLLDKGFIEDRVVEIV
jgi:UDP-N-acetylmuramoyl-tripeptide--D-alanyl-D-alanine ligase